MSITSQVVIDEVCILDYVSTAVLVTKAANNCILLMDDGLQPPHVLRLPQLIVWLGLTSFSTQKGHIRLHPNHVDTSLEKVTKSVYNGSNTYLKPYTEIENTSCNKESARSRGRILIEAADSTVILPNSVAIKRQDHCLPWHQLLHLSFYYHHQLSTTSYQLPLSS